MSHKDGFYTKKIRAKDAQRCKTISEMFAKPSTSSSAVIATETPDSERSTAANLYDITPVTTDNIAVQPSEDESELDDNDQPSTKRKCMPKTTDMRLFNTENYEVKYDWLYYNYKSRGYACKICEHFSSNTNNIFVRGTGLGDHPTRRLESHQNGKTHTDAEQTMVYSKDKTVNIHKLLK